MTLNHIFERLCGIDRDAQALLRLAGFTSDGGLGPQVRPNSDDPDDRFLRDKAESLLQPFAELHEELRYLETPTHGNTLCSSFPMDAMATTTKMAGITSLPVAKLLKQKSATTMGVSTGSAPASSMTAPTTSSGGMPWSRFPG